MLDYTNLAYAFGKPNATGLIKKLPEDFIVNEILGFEPTGSGEHLYLYIEKTGINTEELAKALAQRLEKSNKLISYAGLKDRHALTRQWFSVHCPGEEVADCNSLCGDGWKVIQSTRHNKKLKTGALAGNSFSLLIRDVDGRDEVEQRLAQIKINGVPNYFGEQRFGHDGQNLVKAQRLLFEGQKVKNHFLRGVYYSAARAFLFNSILSKRVHAANWNQAVEGDVMQLSGSHSIFLSEEPDDIIINRLKEFDISPTAPLWGKGECKISGFALEIQQQVLASLAPWCKALAQHRLEMAYRPLVLQIKFLDWNWVDSRDLNLNFELSAGSYATGVVRELLHYQTRFVEG